MFIRALVFAATLLLAGNPVAQAASFVDAAGRVVEVPDRIDKVFVAGPPASVLVYVLAPDKLAGWVREPGEKTRKYLLPEARALPTTGWLTGRGGTANIEAVLASRPDVIIDVGTVNDTYISLADRVQKQTGIPYVLIGGRFRDTPGTLRRAGALLGVGARAEELARYAEERLAGVQSLLRDIPESERPRVYYGRGPKGLETGLAGSINMEVLEVVGAANVAAAAGEGGLSEVSLEQVLAWKPDVILASDARFAETVGSDPLWSTIPAVRSGRVYKAPDVPFGWFDSPPGINRLIGLTWLESVLYPDAGKVDLRAEVRDFFKLFYHVELTEADLDGFVADAGSGN
ncbi:iron ABC transporter substrate-binding protein [Rhizobium sp. GN54]|uniref:iron ABC transporter substrate-binding protein n=1 Tax=Rhizobium sp. GN54 TaxID=2898150 RepID=UPI001E293567|nr:iron ABC transporter substrate-binding protein [Rhizobium sp. GN54]MCD2183014.1 iron ABC transporter substrate-binding protein [Rhizobium sp. GN54]